ncbi:alpha-ketoglutarate-dependent dioxygenase AlkB [Mangrovicoccus algicola]|uniref:Alpha-ketoglutarate-dependent dioxygenase AlkB n=1 Tax=Mangrovicoccus algicola TaxID=2771008 RepID=A0A8J7CKL0_9RHOB|nr:alpha-ketoglutarate-dependent dioxygenase AlkB [Mangrovicoccus algicola]MBE3638956.1 alpha-ketoglutarate-dependent dioxygenase AlkB [Mangrovicoccus algicola]
MELGDVGIFTAALDRAAQEAMVAAVRQVVAEAPLFHPETARGRQMSVRMTSCGAWGWVSDRRGYRYERCHPATGRPWPAIPESVMDLWRRFAGAGARDPESCLVNFYGEGARMGLHQDRDEADFTQPVVSLSLGDDGLFRVGGSGPGGPTRSVWLKSGDVAVLAGPGRLARHGVDRIRFGSSGLLAQGGRLNLTLRVVS